MYGAGSTAPISTDAPSVALRHGYPAGSRALQPSPPARFLSLCSPSGLRTPPDGLVPRACPVFPALCLCLGAGASPGTPFLPPLPVQSLPSAPVLSELESAPPSCLSRRIQLPPPPQTAGMEQLSEGSEKYTAGVLGKRAEFEATPAPAVIHFSYSPAWAYLL